VNYDEVVITCFIKEIKFRGELRSLKRYSKLF